jgi:hypothetical protein
MWNPSPLPSTHYLHLFFEGPQSFSLYYMFIGEEVDVTVIPSVQTCRACSMKLLLLTECLWVVFLNFGCFTLSLCLHYKCLKDVNRNSYFLDTHTRFYLFMIAMWCGCIQWACGTVICTTWVWMGIWDTVSVSLIP